MKDNKPSWLKSKGYLHVTPQINIGKSRGKIISKVQDPSYVAKYAFYPLIHSIIKERRYKQVGSTNARRAHSFRTESGENKKNVKVRPLHYATHMDAIIFSYYAELLQNKYEVEIQRYSGLSNCIIAYRKILTEEGNGNKGTIHFAHEVFEEVKRRCSINDSCTILTLDIKSFFSNLDHGLLKTAWEKLLEVDRLPVDHYNVFKATTCFSYIMLNSLRISGNSHGRKKGFDEKKLAMIRNKCGIMSFFESPKEFRDKIRSGELPLHKYPFRNKEGKPVGIPQGLPISTVLANLYLLDFDLKVLKYLVNGMNAFYRRYSDDIVLICSEDQVDKIKTNIEEFLEKNLVEASKEKTEQFVYRKTISSEGGVFLTPSLVLREQEERIGKSFVYLGFEFNGKNILIKSANLAKFYRRMIRAVRIKAKRAKKIAELTPGSKPVIFRRQLYRLYTSRPLSKDKVYTKWKRLIKIEVGEYRIATERKSKSVRGNYLSYVKRASEIMNEPAILNQLKNHKKIFNSAINRHLMPK